MNLQKHILFCIFLAYNFICVAQNKSTTIQSVDGKKFYIHKIEKGQSLYGVSKLYNVELDQLYNINPELKTGAKAGQEIKIPYSGTLIAVAVITSTSLPIDTSKYVTYKISKGETIYSLSKKFNLTEKKLIKYNPMLDQGLKEGQLIVIGDKIKQKQIKPELKKEPKQAATIVKEKPVVIVDSSLLKPTPKPKKNKYTIALILPFRLDQTLSLDVNALVKADGRFPAVPALAVDFYLGFKRAIDSLTSKDFEVQLALFDIDDKDSTKLVQLVNDKQFKDFDLIFGPWYANGFKYVAKKAKELRIPIVSPITQENKILFNNNYVSKTNPSKYTLIESLADYCADSLATEKTSIFLMAASEKDKKELAFVNDFKKYYNEKQKQSSKIIKDTVRIVKGLAGLKAAYKAGEKNIVVLLTSNHVFIADFTTQLALFGDKKDITLCGWESTSKNDYVDQEYLNQLNYTFPNQFNLNNTEIYHRLIAGYDEQQGTYPSEYYFVGFDVALYYLTNLRDLGPDFVDRLNNLSLESNFQRFKYSRPDNNTGFDNRGVYIFKYNNYQLQKTGWK
jgi:LysM repeat protein/ABC-type branched-subunit amino acid transport system substrate-binding protein